MSVFTAVGILILSALIPAFLILVPSVYANFFHYASGKYSRQKADDLSICFILGVETMTVLMFIFLSIIFWALPFQIVGINNSLLLWIFAGVFFALAVATFCFYYKKNGQLFISRKTARKLLQEPQYVKHRSDAFIYGLASSIPELPFKVPLYLIFIFALSHISLSTFPCAVLIILCAIITTIPLFVIHFLFRTSSNLADYLRFRRKNFRVFRIFVSLLYLILAIILLISGSINL